MSIYPESSRRFTRHRVRHDARATHTQNSTFSSSSRRGGRGIARASVSFGREVPAPMASRGRPVGRTPTSGAVADSRRRGAHCGLCGVAREGMRERGERAREKNRRGCAWRTTFSKRGVGFGATLAKTSCRVNKVSISHSAHWITCAPPIHDTRRQSPRDYHHRFPRRWEDDTW
jgi:hypothetical protein